MLEHKDRSMEGIRNPARLTRRSLFSLMAGAAGCWAFTKAGLAQKNTRLLRVAVSIETLGGANVNDARAAYKVWTAQVASAMGGTKAELVPDVFIPSDQMVQMIRQGTVDMFGITAWEYAKVIDRIDLTTVLLEESVASGLQYVLLVHNASPFKKLADLNGRQLVIHHHRDMNLLPAWLGALLAADNLPPMETFFSQRVSRDSLTQLVLPVFFRRVDAAAVSKSNFDTAVELNPQLGKDLHVLAISPKVVPIALCFHKNCSQEGKKELINIINRTEAMPAGEQIVALYQSRRLVPTPASCMNGTLEMLRQFEHAQNHIPGLHKDHS
jgi:phosphonate transport system substrate-binding protein